MRNIKNMVEGSYAKVAKQNVSCCPTSSCCGSANQAKNISKSVGYGIFESIISAFLTQIKPFFHVFNFVSILYI